MNLRKKWRWWRLELLLPCPLDLFSSVSFFNISEERYRLTRATMLLFCLSATLLHIVNALGTSTYTFSRNGSTKKYDYIYAVGPDLFFGERGGRRVGASFREMAPSTPHSLSKKNKKYCVISFFSFSFGVS